MPSASHGPDSVAQTNAAPLHRPHVAAALAVSAVSVVWTAFTSAAAIITGIRDGTAVIVAFGGVSAVDAIGSIALVHHFRKGLTHEELSDDFERLTHRVVLVGLFVVGITAVVVGAIRAVAPPDGAGATTGIVLAAVSLVVLTALSATKSVLAGRVSSDALRSDGHLSATGAVLAAVTLGGAGAAEWFGWHRADGVATVLVGIGAATVAITTGSVTASRG